MPRQDIFYTTKLPPKEIGYDQTVRAIQNSLSFVRSAPNIQDTLEPAPKRRDPAGSSNSNSSLEYIDLYLIHAPTGTVGDRDGSWKAMLEAQRRGEIKSLGVSNYGVRHLNELQDYIKQLDQEGKELGEGKGWGGEISVWQGEV